jgi:hypothetical protein
MACLSVQQDDGGIFVVCANPIYPLSEEDGILTFEVLEDDSTSMRLRAGKKENYVLDGGRPFLGEVISLEPCKSTHLALSLLSHKSTLKGAIKIHRYLTVGNWTQEN